MSLFFFIWWSTQPPEEAAGVFRRKQCEVDIHRRLGGDVGSSPPKRNSSEIPCWYLTWISKLNRFSKVSCRVPQNSGLTRSLPFMLLGKITRWMGRWKYAWKLMFCQCVATMHGLAAMGHDAKMYMFIYSHPPEHERLEPQGMEVWFGWFQMISLFKQVIFRFWVNFPGWKSSLKPTSLPPLPL